MDERHQEQSGQDEEKSERDGKYYRRGEDDTEGQAYKIGRREEDSGGEESDDDDVEGHRWHHSDSRLKAGIAPATGSGLLCL